MLPNFLILGPPKCASSALHYYLGQHPEIYTSETKETHFFDINYNKGLQFYERYFDKAGTKKIIGEATPTYSYLPFVTERIKKDIPGIKLILCLRNPVERSFSAWQMMTGMGIETHSFRDALEINEKQLGIITFKGSEGAKIWYDSHKKLEAGENRPRGYIQASMYADIIANYYNHFQENQIKIFFLDDLKKDMDKTMKDIFSFLNVNADFIVPNKKIVNFHFNRGPRKFFNRIFGLNFTRFIITNLPKSLKNPVKSKLSSKTKENQKISQEDCLYLWHLLKDDVKRLEKILNKDLSHWNPLSKK